MREEQLVEIVCNHFKNLGYEVEREVKLESKFIDIVAKKEKTIAIEASIWWRTIRWKFPKKEKTIAIEVKVSNWKRAFQQALTYRFGADFVYIAMPEEVIHRIDIKALMEKGIGILSIEGNSVKIVLEAEEQKFETMEV